ncbi:MAG: L-ribulose-5-phosphate 3-epimerase [Verrucomicrobiales bacterium]|jgi:L-ribulose-5-phosphate 3-epimerase
MSDPIPNPKLHPRRQFLKAATLGLGTGSIAATTQALAQEKPAKEKPTRRHSIGVSTYSYWGFGRHDELKPIEKCIDLAAEQGFDGVEILQVQMDDFSNTYAQKLKRHAFLNGLPLMGLSTHQDFVDPDKYVRRHNVEQTIFYVQQANSMGIPTIRINTGRWGTSKNFDELMKNKGIEPRLEGFSDEDGFKWVIDSIEKLIPAAERYGVILGLENHWGLGLTPEGVMRIVDEIDSPWLQVTLDTGNFLEDAYPKQKMLAPKTVFLQAKTYYGGGRWYTLDIDYAKVAETLGKVNFKGWISLEFEGKADPIESCAKSLAMLREHF